jgi:methionine synthase II (cobalamin-independent)
VHPGAILRLFAAPESLGRYLDKKPHIYRSDIVGSLLCPKYLKEAREQFEAVKLSDVEFKSIEDRSVNEAIALQLRTGIDVLTDGEMGRYAFWGHLTDAVEGFEKYAEFMRQRGSCRSKASP